jgi:hypothetical protein
MSLLVPLLEFNQDKGIHLAIDDFRSGSEKMAMKPEL